MKNKSRYVLIISLLVSEIIICAIHLYYGICSFLEMIYDILKIELYYTLFWNYKESTYKYWNYMNNAITYYTNPIYCILISIIILILSILIIVLTKHKRDKNLDKVIIRVSVFVLIITLMITTGVIYCYFYELSTEVV